ncbi:hypothetical protein [Leifsonia sp. LS-T14]|uniref:hypothetical protein n=1 Tax=unclassified Leifsonia TaxID=2663824 RepID=UPI0035A6156A
MDKERAQVNSSIRLRYYIFEATLAGASIVAFAVLPSYLAGAVGSAAVIAVVLIERIAYRSVDTRPRGIVAVLYFVGAALLYVGSLLLAVTVAKEPGALWVALGSAGVVFVVFVGAAWVPNRATERD